jgi:hypothetical protein
MIKKIRIELDPNYKTYIFKVIYSYKHQNQWGGFNRSFSLAKKINYFTPNTDTEVIKEEYMKWYKSLK